MPVDHLKAFLKMGFSLGKAVGDFADGFQLSDLGDVVSAAKSVPGGLAAAPAALAEYVNMTDEEAKPLEDWVVSEFDLANDTVELAIETALKFVIDLHGLVRLLLPKSVVG